MVITTAIYVDHPDSDLPALTIEMCPYVKSYLGLLFKTRAFKINKCKSQTHALF